MAPLLGVLARRRAVPDLVVRLGAARRRTARPRASRLEDLLLSAGH